VVNVGGRDIDGLKELGYEIRTVPCYFKKVLVLCNLVDGTP
jgi:hypothetical protein